MSKVHFRKYGEAFTIPFDLFETDGINYKVDAVYVSGDVKIMKDEGAEANITSGFTDEGQGYSIPVSATEAQAARIELKIVDQGTKVWLDTGVSIETYGHASAQHAFDLDTAIPGVDVVQISGDATAADNVELMYDGTGYTDDTAPASRSQVNGIGAASGGSLSFQNEADNIDSAIKGVPFVGVETSGTNASVNFNDGVYHNIDDTGNDIDIVYQYDVGGGRTAVEVIWIGLLNSNNDAATIQAYNGSTWDTIAIITGKNGSTNDTEAHSLFLAHTGVGADLGKVYIRIQCSAQSNPSLFTDQLIVSAVNIGLSIGYAGGAIWVDTNASNTNTESFVDGVADNPVSTWAAALTLSAALNINRFKIASGSAITLTANSDNYEIAGQAYTLALGGQSIDGLYVFGGAISGTGTNTSVAPIFEDCPVGDVTLPPSIFRRCFLSGTITSSGVGDWYINHCMSRVAGTASPVFDFGAAVGDTNLNMRLWSGGIQLESMGDTGTDTASIEGNGQIIEGTCTGGTVAIRGNFTVSGITNLTLSDKARYTALPTENLFALIESQRGSHTGKGNVFYYDFINGNDANDGLSEATAKKTWAGVNALVAANNHDIVILVPGESAAQTVITEVIDVDKAYTFVRGPGRDVKFKPIVNNADTVTVSAVGCEFSGAIVETAATGNRDAIKVTGGFALIHNFWVDQSRGSGVDISGVSNCIVEDFTIQDAAAGGSGHGIFINGNVTDAKRNIICSGRILDNAGDGIKIAGVNAVNNFIVAGEEGMLIHGNTGWGVNETDSADDTQVIGPNIHTGHNTLGAVNLIGANSCAENIGTPGVTRNRPLDDFEFLMQDAVDHISGKTGLTVTAQRSIDGAAFAACANAVSEVANGIYVIDLAASDLNGDFVTFKFTAADADDRLISIKTRSCE